MNPKKAKDRGNALRDGTYVGGLRGYLEEDEWSDEHDPRRVARVREGARHVVEEIDTTCDLLLRASRDGDEALCSEARRQIRKLLTLGFGSEHAGPNLNRPEDD